MHALQMDPVNGSPQAWAKSSFYTVKQEQIETKLRARSKQAAGQKEDEIAAGQEQIETKTQELAITDEKLANSKEDPEDTRNTPSADEKFLMDLKEKCHMTDQQWEERQRT